MSKHIEYYTVSALAKVILCIAMSFTDNNSNISQGTYNFITLFGAIVFIVSFILEFKKERYILSLFAFVGLIIFQPIVPILKNGIGYHDVIVNMDFLQIAFGFLFFWIIYDAWVILELYRKKKPQ